MRNHAYGGDILDSQHTPAATAVLSVPPTDAHPHRPCLGTVVRRVSLSLLIACVIPATLFYSVFALAGVWTAIVVALGWSYGAIAWRALTGRRTSGLLLLTALLLTVRTALALLTDSTWLYFLQPIISDGVVATAFLLSLVSARPMVARLAGDFYPMDHELSVRPRIRRLFRNLTVLWALLGLGKATMTLWLLQSTSLETFVLVKSISALSINMLAATATIALAAYVGRQEGLLGPVPKLVPVLA
ncbi:MAG: yciB [Nocardioides sp.]|nr:yciB [Nocardioides sp.]